MSSTVRPAASISARTAVIPPAHQCLRLSICIGQQRVVIGITGKRCIHSDDVRCECPCLGAITDKACWPLVPASPHTTGPVACCTGKPSRPMYFPLLHRPAAAMRGTSNPGRKVDHVGWEPQVLAVPNSQKRTDERYIFPSRCFGNVGPSLLLRLTIHRKQRYQEHAMLIPTGPQRLYRPPTQSRNPKTFALSTPNPTAAGTFVETAAKCSATGNEAD